MRDSCLLKKGGRPQYLRERGNKVDAREGSVAGNQVERQALLFGHAELGIAGAGNPVSEQVFQLRVWACFPAQMSWSLAARKGRAFHANAAFVLQAV